MSSIPHAGNTCVEMGCYLSSPMRDLVGSCHMPCTKPEFALIWAGKIKLLNKILCHRGAICSLIQQIVAV